MKLTITNVTDVQIIKKSIELLVVEQQHVMSMKEKVRTMQLYERVLKCMDGYL